MGTRDLADMITSAGPGESRSSPGDDFDVWLAFSSPSDRPGDSSHGGDGYGPYGSFSFTHDGPGESARGLVVLGMHGQQSPAMDWGSSLRGPERTCSLAWSSRQWDRGSSLRSLERTRPLAWPAGRLKQALPITKRKHLHQYKKHNHST